MYTHLIHTMYTHLLTYINPWFCSMQDLGSLTCCSRSEEFSNWEPMVDDWVVDIIKALGLEGLLRTPGREIDHGLITALVERWRPETHTFHMPHGEVTIAGCVGSSRASYWCRGYNREHTERMRECVSGLPWLSTYKWWEKAT